MLSWLTRWLTRLHNRRSTWLWAAAIAGYAFLYLPLVIVVVYSFNDSRLNAEWVGFTLDWYRKLARNEEMQIAAANSLVIAFATSLVSTVLGTMAGVAMHRYKLRLLSRIKSLCGGRGVCGVTNRHFMFLLGKSGPLTNLARWTWTVSAPYEAE